MSKPSITNCPNTFFRKFIVSTVCWVWIYQECQIYHLSFLICHYSCFACVQIRHNPLSGGYCGGVPPLPIPNREVKPTCADGTAMQCGRVGRRLLSMKSLRFRKISEAFLFFFPRIFFFSAGFFFSLNISLSRRFRRWRRFFLIDYLSPTDFTDLHRFSSFFCHFFISQILDLSVWEDFADFCSYELEKDYADFLSFSSFYGYSDDFYYYNFLLCLFFCDNFG